MSVVVKGADGVVASALRNIYKTYGSVTRENVLEEASNPTHPLHDRFEWDDSIAAHEHRLEQARKLIQSVRVTIVPTGSSEPISVRAYVAERDITTSTQAGTYVAIESVIGSTAHQVSLKRSIERDLESLRKKYAATEEFFEAVAQDWISAMSESDSAEEPAA